MVGILILVDHQVAETLLIGLEDVGVVLEQQVSVQKQVVEVERVGGLQALLQALVNARGHLAHRVAYRIGKGFGNLQLVFRRGDAVADGVYGETARVDVELGHYLFHQALGIGVVVDGEVLGEAQHVGVGAQHAHAHAVEGGNPHAAHGRADEPCKRSRISAAALLVKVMAIISHGATPPSWIMCAMRYVSTRVLPDPAPASTKRGPSVHSTA